MKIISWNINGIRAAVRKGFSVFLKKEKPDILLLQEVKIHDTAREREVFDFAGYEEYWNSAQRPGYSGTAILVKSGLNLSAKQTHPSQEGPTPSDLKSETPSQEGNSNVAVRNGMGILEFDEEGRGQTAELPGFYLVNAYFPNANHELSRLGYKLDFNGALLRYVKKLEKKKPVIIAGDLNVAHREIDLARPKDNVGNPGFTAEERAWADKLVRAGYVDSFRYFHKDKVQYSWWSYRFNARARNIGWRIDYFFVSPKIIKKVKEAFILDSQKGSDHCPVGIEINS